MNNKKWYFDEETKLFVAISEASVETMDKASEKKPAKRLTEWLSTIISSIALVVSVIAVIISNQQKELDKTQTDIANSQLTLNARQFDAEKKPVFAIHVESQDIYTDAKYKTDYRNWLRENNIDSYFDWQYSNWVDGKLEYDFNPNEYLSEKEIEKYHLSVKDVWKYNRYLQDQDVAKYFDGQLAETDVPINNLVFWDTYIEKDYTRLNEITNGEFYNFSSDYLEYLDSSGYISYSDWKTSNSYVIQQIMLENAGAYITDGKLDIYIFKRYSFISEELNINYKFGIDMNGTYLSAAYSGSFNKPYYLYDTRSNTFSLVFATTPLAEHERVQYDGIREVWKHAHESVKFLKTGDSITHTITSDIIYFSISYLDVEKTYHRDWYIYDPVNCTLTSASFSNTGLDEPLITQYADSVDYFTAESEYIAKCLGHSNSQYRGWLFLDSDYEYIHQAEEKLLADLASLFQQ